MINYNQYKDIFKNYYRTLVVFAISRYGLSSDESEDIVQDIFIKIWKQNNHIETSKIRGLLYTSVRNGAIDLIRAKKHHETFEFGSIEETLSFGETKETEMINFEYEIERSEKVRSIYIAIESLPKKCKVIFKKIYFEEKDYNTVALEMDLSINTVKVQMFRAYTKLRNMLLLIIVIFILIYYYL